MENIFYKYECFGNSFIIVQFNNNLNYKEFSKKICSKEYGIGADGLIVVDELLRKMLFFNQDGSKASFCGNGCLAYLTYLNDIKKTSKNIIPFIFENELYYGKTLDEKLKISELIINRNTQVDLKIKAKYNNFKKEISFGYSVILNNKQYILYPLKVGVFHIVIINDTDLTNNQYLSELDILELKKSIKNIYLEEPNIDIVKISNGTLKDITFYERGVGYTKSCGSGSVSIAVICELMGLLKNNILKINDELMVILKKDTIELIGKANLICMGEYY